MHAGELRATLRVVLPYVVVAGAWIFFSDAALLWLTADPLLVNRLQSLKGLLFVLVTAALLFVLLQRELQRRRSTEAALSESQRFAAQMADALPGLLFLYDFAAQRHVYVSQGLTTILGYTPDQIAALGDGALPGLIHPDDWRAFAEGGPAHYAGLRDGQTLENNFRVRHADGSWRWLHSREVVYSRDAQGQPQRFLGVALDISHQRAAEEQLRESERRFRALTEASPAGIFRTDAQGQQTYVNERWCEIMSLTAEQGLGTGLLAAVHPADREQVWAVWTAAVAAGRPAEAEFRLQHPDRSITWVLARAVDERDEAGELNGFLGTVTDVTGLKQAEARAQRLARVYAVLSDINQIIVRVRERGRLFEAACRTAVEAGGFRLAWIGLADQATGRVAVMASAGATGDYLERLQINLADEPASRGPVNWALRQGHSAVSNDVEHDDRLGPWRADALRLGYRAIAAFPLVILGEVQGVFVLYADEPGVFDAEEIKLLDELAQDLAFALEFMEREIQRQQTEAALQASEARFRTFFEQAPVYCYMLTPAGVILDANAALCAALGYTRAELVGTPASRLYAPQARARAQAAFEHWQATGQVRDEELIIQARSGAERVVLLSASAVRDAAGQVLYSLSVQRDITDRVQAEAALRESETRYRQVVDQSPVGIALVQAGRLVFANPALARLLGAADSPDLLGRPVQDFIDPETWPATQERLARIAAGHSILTPVINRYRRLDGTRVDVEVTGVPSAYLEQGAIQVMVQDVTERRQAEAALRESEARYRLLAENMADVVWLLDTATQRFKYISPSVTGLLGYSVAEVSSRTVADLISDAARELIATALPERLAAFQAGDPAAVTQRHEVEQLRRDGSSVWTEVLTTVLWNEAGGLDVLGVSRDIVERKRAETALRESEARARAMYQAIPDLIFRLDRRGVFLDYKAETGDLHTQHLPTLIGWRNRDIAPADFADLIEQQIDRTLASGALQTFEYQLEIPGRGLHDYEARMTPSGPAEVLAIVRDITERKQAEAALRESEVRYRGLFEHMLDGVAYCRMIFAAGLPQDWIYLKVNPAFEALTGLRGAEGRRVSEVIPNIRATDPHLFEIYGRVALTGHPERFEAYVAALEMWFDVHVFSPEREHFVAVFDVITERKQAEAALRASEARYRNLIDHAPDAIFINRDNRIVLVNAAALRLFGAAAPEQLLGRPPYDLFHADDHAAIRERIRRLVELAEPALPREERIVRLDGGVVDVEVSAAPFQDQGTLAIHVILRDITERKRVETALQAAEERHRRLIENLPNIVVNVFDRDLRVTFAAGAELRARSVTAAQVLGKRLDEIMPPETAALAAPHLRATLAGEAVSLEASVQGGMTYAISAAPLHQPDGSVGEVLVVAQNITTAKQQAAAIEQQLAMLNALYAQAHQLAQSLDPVQVAASVVRQCGETFGARLAWLGVAEPDGRVEVLAHYPLEDDYPRQVRVRWDTAPEGFGPTGRALRERAPVISTDLEAPAYAAWRPATAQRGFRASAAFPLVSREQPLGALNLYSDRPDFFSAERVALFQAFAQQAAAALANARLFQAVSEQREQLRGLAARVAEVEEAERRSLARELHDRVGANLTALNISLTIVRGRLSAETLAVAGPRLDDALTLLQETMVQVRDVMMDLRPSVLDDYGLLAALRWYAQQLGRRSGQTVLVANAGAEPRLPAAAETALFRVAQEALTNVIKHARAAQAEVRLETDAGRARLVIADDGVGFDPGLSRGGWGMVNMRERVEAVGGRLHVESQPGRGATISVEVDL